MPGAVVGACRPAARPFRAPLGPLSGTRGPCRAPTISQESVADRCRPQNRRFCGRLSSTASRAPGARRFCGRHRSATLSCDIFSSLLVSVSFHRNHRFCGVGTGQPLSPRSALPWLTLPQAPSLTGAQSRAAGAVSGLGSGEGGLRNPNSCRFHETLPRPVSRRRLVRSSHASRAPTDADRIAAEIFVPGVATRSGESRDDRLASIPDD